MRTLAAQLREEQLADEALIMELLGLVLTVPTVQRMPGHYEMWVKSARSTVNKAKVRMGTTPIEWPDEVDPPPTALLQDFACGVSDAIWGGELGWCKPDEELGLKALLEAVRGVVRERHELPQQGL